MQNVTKRKVELKGAWAGLRAALHSAVLRSHCGLRSTAAIADARHTAACALVPHCPTLGTAPPVATHPPMQTNNRLPSPTERWRTISLKYYLIYVIPTTPKLRTFHAFTLTLHNTMPHPRPTFPLPPYPWWFIMTTEVCILFQRINSILLKWRQSHVLKKEKFFNSCLNGHCFSHHK